jgi:DNA-binding transcriptional LysR family regulator
MTGKGIAMAINEMRAIAIFVSTAELGSLRKAAAEHGISPQAASDTLAQLERHLDVRLFHRTTRSMSLTDEGLRFLETAKPSLLGLQHALQTARRTKDEIAGPLRIVGPRTTFQVILWRLIDEFCQAHPGIVPDVQLEDRVGNWVEDRVDVGFRLGGSPNEGVIARRLFPVQLVACASPEYLHMHGAPKTIADLQSHRCSVYRHPASGVVLPWRLKDGHDTVELPLAPALCTNDEVLELEAVLGGRVIGQLAGVTAAPYIRSGKLVPLLGDHTYERGSYFVHFGSRSSQPARARAFIDLALARLLDNAEYVLSPRELRGPKRRA